MNAFSDADLDRLADFVGGALDGTPEADDVRHLVSTDVRWAEAYATLVTAESAVRDELRALGDQAPAVPPDVQQRLDAALAAAITAPPAGAPVIDLARARAARNRRRARWAGALATAAAVLVGGGVGVQMLRHDVARDSASTAAPDVAAAAPSPADGHRPDQSGAGSPLLSSGRDYGPDTLDDLAQGGIRASGKSAQNMQAEGGGSTSAGPAGVPGPLTRLNDPAARADCLNAITKEYGGQVALVDYARFEGQPALVVLLDGTRVGAGKRLIVVVGPSCGLGGAIGDERYRTTTP